MHLHEDDVERGEGCRQAQDVQDGRHEGGLAFFIDSSHKSLSYYLNDQVFCIFSPLFQVRRTLPTFRKAFG